MVKSSGPVQGSFGIPEELERLAQKKKVEKEPAQEEAASEKPQHFSQPQPSTDKGPESQEDEIKLICDGLGIKITSDDFDRFIFHNDLQKTVEIIKGKLTATFIPMKSGWWKEIEAIIANENQKGPLTYKGIDYWTASLTLSFCVTHLQGKPIGSEIKSDSGDLDYKAMALEKLSIFEKMSPAVVNVMILKQASFERLFQLLVTNPGDYLKNS